MLLIELLLERLRFKARFLRVELGLNPLFQLIEERQQVRIQVRKDFLPLKNHFEQILSENFGDSDGPSEMVDAWISAGIEPETLRSIFEANFPALGLEAVVKIYSALLAEESLWLPSGIFFLPLLWIRGETSPIF